MLRDKVAQQGVILSLRRLLRDELGVILRNVDQTTTVLVGRDSIFALETIDEVVRSAKAVVQSDGSDALICGT